MPHVKQTVLIRVHNSFEINTTKLAPTRRDPVPEIVWTVMLCVDRELAINN